MELAVSLPMIMLLMLGSIEASNAIYLKQTVTQAAYEAARLATATGGTEEEARQRAQAVLTARKVNGAAIVFSPTVRSNLEAGTEVTTTVSAPVGNNAVIPTWLFPNLTVKARIAMTRI